MPIYEVTLRGEYYAQQTINVFHYVTAPSVFAAPSALKLLTLMGFIPVGDPAELPDGTVFAGIRGLVSNNQAFLEVEARNLYSVTDFYLAAYNPAVVGLADGIDYSPVGAYGFRSNRTRTDIRRGFKRFSGVVEEATTNGGIIVTPYDGLMEDLADLLGAVLDGETDDVYNPAILSFEKYETPAGNDAYKPYETEAEQEEHAMVGISYAPYTTLRTQNSRQYGRGS